MGKNERLIIEEKKGYVRPSEVGTLPETFGVYLMKDSQAHVIYVGKAKNLKRRVSSYFQKNHSDIKTQQLVEHIDIIDYITVGNEAESLILEATLIKKYSPHYNVMFKDNKFYPFIKVTVNEDYPRIVFARSRPKDGSRYFGPFISSYSVRKYIDMIQRLFKIRTCREMPKKECLNYHIKRCSAPCIGEISAEEYRHQTEQALELLEGNIDSLTESLGAEMMEAAGNLEFEKAQALKEKIEALSYFNESQNVYIESGIDADFVSFSSKMGKILFVSVIIRHGKMVGKRSYTATLKVHEDETDVLEKFLIKYYGFSDKKEKYLIIDEKYKNIIAALNNYFKETEGDKIKVAVPEDDNQKALLKIALENASLHLAQVISRVDASESLGLLQNAIETDRLPMRIEGFDIANILGEHSVASMVSFYAAKPDKKNYRKFKIRIKDTPDDFAMMHEVIYRRYKRLRDEEKEFPDLILVDGGKGQLNAALSALDELGLDLNIVSLAKKNEEIYRPGESDPIVLPKNSPALHVLQRVRDESHRFANTFYNQLKRKALTVSLFDDVPGIGEKRKEIILKKFLNYKNVDEISLENLISEGIPKTSVKKVYNRLKNLYNK